MFLKIYLNICSILALLMISNLLFSFPPVCFLRFYFYVGIRYFRDINRKKKRLTLQGSLSLEYAVMRGTIILHADQTVWEFHKSFLKKPLFSLKSTAFAFYESTWMDMYIPSNKTLISYKFNIKFMLSKKLQEGTRW